MKAIQKGVSNKKTYKKNTEPGIDESFLQAEKEATVVGPYLQTRPTNTSPHLQTRSMLGPSVVRE